MSTQLTATRYSNDSFQLHGLINGVAQSSAVTLRCLSEIEHNANIKTIEPETGAPYVETSFVEEEKPELATSVCALASLLDVVGINGANCITADGSHPGIRAFMQAHNACAANGRASGSGHQRVTVAKSHLVIGRLGGASQKTAYASIKVHELSADGDAACDAVVYNAALPGTIVDNEEFVIATPTVADFRFDPESVLNWWIDPGVKLTSIIPAGGTRPTVVYIEKVPATIMIEHNDGSLEDAAKIPRDGIECTHANTVFPLRKRDEFGHLIALASSVHIGITAAGFAFHSRRYRASGSGIATGEVTVRCLEGVGGVPLAVDTTYALA